MGVVFLLMQESIQSTCCMGKRVCQQQLTSSKRRARAFAVKGGLHSFVSVLNHDLKLAASTGVNKWYFTASPP